MFFELMNNLNDTPSIDKGWENDHGLKGLVFFDETNC